MQVREWRDLATNGCLQDPKSSPGYPPTFWGQCEDNSTYAIEFVGEGAVIFRGNEFQQPGGNHILLGPRLRSAIVTENTFASEIKMLNLMGKANRSESCVVAMNVQP